MNDFAGPIATYRILEYFFLILLFIDLFTSHLSSYLESPEPYGKAQPWAWIIWLALGPLVSTLAMQWALWVKVCHFLLAVFQNH